MQSQPMARAQMNADIANAYRTDKLSLFYQEHDFDDFEHALNAAQEPFSLRKVVLRMDYPDRFAGESQSSLLIESESESDSKID